MNADKANHLVEKIKNNPSDVRFADLVKICEHYFGKPRNKSTSHMIFKTPWQGDPRINIQNNKNKAKSYQVKQVLLALDKLKKE